MDFPATSGTGTRAPTGSSWSTVFCLSLLCFALVASEFMPVILLGPAAIGFIAQHSNIGVGFAIIAAGLLLVGLAGPLVYRR
ncbi:hypothetical protein [Kaistia sp. MMO-174]|uniref:hypothetical protein n=1 Tax=Kaistia sp. MMO-174 TaxID=3081256 RepID=UPI0030185FC0